MTDDVLPVLAAAAVELAAMREAYPLPAADELDHVQTAGEAALFTQGVRPATRRAYISALRYWDAWHRACYGTPLPLFLPPVPTGEDGQLCPPPVPPATVRAFVVHHAPRRDRDRITMWMPEAVRAQLKAAGVFGRRRVAKSKPVTGTAPPATGVGGLAIDPDLPSHATLKQRLDLLYGAHRKLGLPSPGQLDPRLGQLLIAARTATAELVPAALTRKKSPLRADHMRRLVASCTDGLAGVRDRAMLLVAYDSGGRRRSEVVSLDVEHLKSFNDAGTGLDGYLWGIERTKTAERQDAHTAAQIILIAGDAAAALDAWLDVLRAHGVVSGAVFRRIRRPRPGRDAQLGGRLTDKEYVRDVIVARARKYLPDFDQLDLAGHSARSGFITEGKKRGASDSDLMAMSGHTDQKTFSGYYQVDAPMDEAARVLAIIKGRHAR